MGAMHGEGRRGMEGVACMWAAPCPCNAIEDASISFIKRAVCGLSKSLL